MKKNTLKGAVTLTLLLFTLSINAQKAPMKYGKVDKADLEMKIYPQDSTAAAVMLCNYGYFDAQELQFVHQRRIKILKEEGKKYGSFLLPASEKANVKGQIVNLENGVPVVTKLSKEGIFIEKVTNNYYRARIAMPNVKVGSVIDVEVYYTGLPNVWEFQKEYPVRWSELVLEQSTYFSFRKTFNGYIRLNETSDDRWVAKDVPAFKEEPYMDNPDNYMSRFDIEISSIHIPGTFYKDYATNWGAVGSTLNGDSQFGGVLTGFNLYMNGLAKEISSKATSPEEKMNKAFEAIKRVKWNDKESVTTTTDNISSALSKKIGNSADINMLLIVLLRKLDIEANPVVLSSRSNGKIQPYSVSLDKLNYVVVQAEIGEQKYLMDATEENIPLGLLPDRALNGRGLVVRKNTAEWIDINPINKDKKTSIISMKLQADGKLKGHIDRTYFDYAALDERISYKKNNSQDEFIKSIESDNNGLSVDNFKIENIDSLNKSLNESYDFVLKNKVTKLNDQLFLSPIIFDNYNENPFKATDRVYPVDFVTPIERTFMVQLELPEGYTIDQLPKDIKASLPENTASFTMRSSLSENTLQVLFKLNINKAVFFQNEYNDLKTFFDELVKKQTEMLTIKKV